MSTTLSSEDLLSLPIDQYTRQKWASAFIDQLRNKNQKLKILDVGGYKGKTAVFQAHDSVTVCDLFDVDEPNYVQGDGRSLPFKKDEFDFVVTFDTYEHVPRDGRKNFIAELMRVAKHGVIVAAPFDNDDGSVFQAEVNLNNYHKQLYNEEHRWLQEHIEYRIPGRDEIETLIDDIGGSYCSLASNDLNIWVLMQTIYFSIELDTEIRGRVDDVNRYYNKQYINLDIASDKSAYRHIYFISSKNDNARAIENYINQEKNIINENEKTHFIAYALSMFGVKYRDVQTHDQYLEKEVARLHAQNMQLQQQLEERINEPVHQSIPYTLTRRASKKIRRHNKKDA